QWGFYVVTYANAADAAGDVNRIQVGNPWLESERPGDVRTWYNWSYNEGTAQFTGVSVSPGATSTVTGTLAPFTPVDGRTYQIMASIETDVEYCWALEPVSGAGAFAIERNQPITGAVKLRLVEQFNGCTIGVVGQVWAEENAAAGSATHY